MTITRQSSLVSEQAERGEPLPGSRGAGSAILPQVLVAGIGHLHVRDLAVGPLVIERLVRESWPEGVLIEDFSYGPVGVMHRLDEIGVIWRTMIFIGAQSRGREPGVYELNWTPPVLDDEEVQERFEAGSTGIIDLENFLIVASRFDKLTGEVRVIELEPEDSSWGEELSPVATEALEWIPSRVRELVSTILGSSNVIIDS